MFLTEKELKEAFWKKYNYSNRAKRYQFECPLREGNTDLVTVELFQDEYQINCFEFKLNDIKKVILQAKANIPYCNKSWIVVPIEKRELLQNRYEFKLKELKHIGVIGVHESGRWEIIHRPLFQKEVILNQALIKMMMLV